MKTNTSNLTRNNFFALALGLAVMIVLTIDATVACAQALPPGVQDVVKLKQAGLSDEVILAQIRNSGAAYNLTADQIIYLKNQGVSQMVIQTLIGGNPAATPTVNAAPTASPAPAAGTPLVPTLAPAVAAPTPATPTASLDSFQSQLAPYGTWIQVPGYGLCWQPTVAMNDPMWRPYFDQGYWTYTDAGWCWVSDYAWGNIVFHYGRWSRFHGIWIWAPGYDWAPAWVCWREADGYCGWAPLPPTADYKVGVGLYYNGHVALDVDFGLGMDDFTFVAYDHFWDHDLRPYDLPHDRVVVFFHSSHVLNGYRMDHGHFVVEGLGHDHVVVLTHHDVRGQSNFRNSSQQGPRNFDNRGSQDNRHGQHGW